MSRIDEEKEILDDINEFDSQHHRFIVVVFVLIIALASLVLGSCMVRF